MLVRLAGFAGMVAAASAFAPTFVPGIRTASSVAAGCSNAVSTLKMAAVPCGINGFGLIARTLTLSSQLLDQAHVRTSSLSASIPSFLCNVSLLSPNQSLVLVLTPTLKHTNKYTNIPPPPRTHTNKQARKNLLLHPQTNTYMYTHRDMHRHTRKHHHHLSRFLSLTHTSHN